MSTMMTTTIRNESDTHHGYVDVRNAKGEKARWIIGPLSEIRKRIADTSEITKHSPCIVVTGPAGGRCCGVCSVRAGEVSDARLRQPDAVNLGNR